MGTKHGDKTIISDLLFTKRLIIQLFALINLKKIFLIRNPLIISISDDW